ncbi:dTDP-glucose 4,6-dehydratase [Bifidobacterium dolichotidis]|uniref:dTDP-glucose 4,6-dehydratase n=1 Tax=Bifidobacterium dolichotidis TaxID=2306976 RepID=A0A430FSY1_9BIFI|nr:NAD-dependent epimerase/dehydratase family protein [Bifidobacterium dolichotidis]RSX55927.1 dTDP-glucose 4,6-dehydratase [Bifidobacterium dolichotidis]
MISIQTSSLYRDQIRQLAASITMPAGATVLVTGATGLVGSCLVDVLAATDTGIRVIATSRSLERLTQRFEYLLNDERIKLMRWDAADPLHCDDPVDYVIHAASNASPSLYEAHPVQTLLTNVEGTRHVLDFCQDKGARMLLTSTFEVYGNVIASPQGLQEDAPYTADLSTPRSCYPESKRCAEVLIQSYASEFGTDALIARLGSVYGPTMLDSDNKAHAQFFRKALAKQDIVMNSAGLPRRTYSYVIDVASALLFLLVHGETAQAYNVASSGESASIAEIAEHIAHIAGTYVQKPELSESDALQTAPNHTLNGAKIHALGWASAYSLDEGLRSTIAILQQSSE